MKRLRYLVIGVCLVVIMGVFAGRCSAQEEREGLAQWLQEVGVFGGTTFGPLKYQDDKVAFPLGMRFGFDLKPFTRKFNFDPKGMLEFLVEPFLAYVTEPQDELEMGLGFILRYAYPLTERLYPFIEAGPGLHYTTLHTFEQGTQFNFSELGGVGFIFFLNDDTAVNIGYRFRHVSNAGIKHPNGGIETSHVLAGVSFYY